MSMDYAIILAPLNEEDGGGYLGFAPDLPGCMSDGETMDEALANTREAIIEWIDTANRRGLELPMPGSAARREREEKEHLVASLKELAGGMDHIESRIEELERFAREAQERLNHEAAWARFADLTKLPMVLPRRQRLPIC